MSYQEGQLSLMAAILMCGSESIQARGLLTGLGGGV